MVRSSPHRRQRPGLSSAAPGWFYWTTDDGKTLDHLRQELLTTLDKEVAANTEPDDPETWGQR